MSQIIHLDLPTGLRMEVEHHGADAKADGPRPFVLVHGFTGSRDDWLEQLPALAQRGPTIALDQRGHGGSHAPGQTGPHALAQLRDDLAAALDALGLAQCDLLGHSMGGVVALEFVLAHPDRVASLVLMDTTPHPIALLPPALHDATVALIQAAGMEGLADAMEGATRAGKAPQPPAVAAAIERMGADEHWRRIRAKLLAMEPGAFEGLGRDLAQWAGCAARLSEIACPTTVIVGEQDAPFRGPSDDLAAGIPGASLSVIADAAHSPQIENAEAWRAVVLDHLKRARG